MLRNKNNKNNNNNKNRRKKERKHYGGKKANSGTTQHSAPHQCKLSDSLSDNHKA